MRVIYDLVRDGLSAINDAAARLNTAREQVATGRRIRAVGDDPLAVDMAIRERASLAAVDAYSRSRDAASAKLAAADNVLAGVVDKITAAIVAGTSARGSSVAPAVRSAAVQTIQSLRASLLGDVNTTFNGSYLFAGTEVGTLPYDKAGGTWSYHGDTQTTTVEIERGHLVSTTFDGSRIVKGTDTTDLFTALDDLETAVTAGDDVGMGTALAALDRAFDRALDAQGRLGADERGIDDAAGRLTALRLAAETRRAALEDADLAEAVTRMTQADAAYRAALGAVSTAERQSLLDYLR